MGAVTLVGNAYPHEVLGLSENPPTPNSRPPLFGAMGASPIQLLDALMPPTKETYIYRSVIISPINDQYAKMRQVSANGIFFVISSRYDEVPTSCLPRPNAFFLCLTMSHCD